MQSCALHIAYNIRMNAGRTIIFVFFSVLLACPAPLHAWGSESHRIIGQTALSMTDKTAFAAVVGILGSDSKEAVARACFWPDTVRESPGWEWSAPQHYVNIPRSALHYDRQRDCGDGMCVTEAISKYANELSRPDLDPDKRWQAFAWLCHVVGDLHQPLHAGYRDDRGGNYVNVEYKGESWNLHQFWDWVLIRDRLGRGDRWDRPFGEADWTRASGRWNPKESKGWTDESHALVASSAYPDKQIVDELFADQSWLIIRQQWQKAAHRLARILNATIGAGEVAPIEQASSGSEISGDPESDAGVPPVGLGGYAVSRARLLR